MTATITVGAGDSGVAVNPAGTAAYVTNRFDGTVSVISTVTNTVTATISGFTAPDGIAFSPQASVAAPAVTSVSPGRGPTAGGTTVTISGSGLLAVSAITFGAGHNATEVSCNLLGTSCTAVSPAETAGTVNVQVTNALGTSAAVTGDQYTYAAPPAVTKISPAAGPTAGGTTVTISGTSLSGATAITFGPGHNATSVSCTATSCTAVSPAEAAGTVNVQVTTPYRTSATSTADHYTCT